MVLADSKRLEAATPTEEDGDVWDALPSHDAPIWWKLAVHSNVSDYRDADLMLWLVVRTAGGVRALESWFGPGGWLHAGPPPVQPQVCPTCGRETP